MMKRLRIANFYDSVDVRGKLARNYIHVPGARLQPLCRKLGIRYADALVGFRGNRFGYKPILDGVVVSARSAPKLLEAIEEREQRSEQLAERRQRKQQREVMAFTAAIKEQFPGCPDREAHQIAAHACEVGSGRVGRTSSLSLSEKVHRAVVAHVRHCLTDYEDLLLDCHDQDDRAFAREQVREQISAVLERWAGDDKEPPSQA